jgi:hypothetical protein
MNLGDIQPYVYDLISKHPQLAGVPMVMDDGTYPKIPAREVALTTKGVFIVVGQITARAVDEAALSGHNSLEIEISVCFECNPAVSATPMTGVNIPAPTGIQHILEAVSGKPADADERLQMDKGNPFENLPSENGIHRMAATFTMPKLICPLS